MQDVPPEKPGTSQSHADRLNQQCFCITLDRRALYESLRRQFWDTGNGALDAPNLQPFFSSAPVFVPQAEIRSMELVVQAIEGAAALSPFKERALSWAPEIAGFDPGPIGAFMGYDFHLTPDGPQLIEINTNAGGAFLNAVLARAQHRCCTPPLQDASTNGLLDGLEGAVLAMFQQEWQRQGRDSAPARLASPSIWCTTGW